MRASESEDMERPSWFDSNELDLLLDFVERFEPLTAGASLAEISRMLMQRDVRGGEQSAMRAYQTALVHVRRKLAAIEARYKIQMRFPKGGELEDTVLTNEGAQFIADVRQFRDSLERVLTVRPRISIYLSAIDAAIQYWIPEALQKKGFFENVRYHHVDLRLAQREAWEVIRDVRSGAAHLGIGTLMEHEEVEAKRFLVREHVIAFHESLRSRFRKVVEASMLENTTVLCLHDYIAPIAVEWRMERLGMGARIITMNTLSQIMSWVVRGLGVALVPADVVFCPGVETRPFQGFNFKAVDCLYSPKGKARQQAMPPEVGDIKRMIVEYWAEHTPK